MIADFAAVLIFAVIINGYGSAAEINIFANIGIADICEVCAFGAVAHNRVFNLHKIADVNALAELAACTDFNKRAAIGAVLNLTVEQLNIIEHNIVADNAILNISVWADNAILADFRVAQNNRVWQNLRICANFNLFAYHNAVCARNINAVYHMAVIYVAAHNII